MPFFFGCLKHTRNSRSPYYKFHTKTPFQHHLVTIFYRADLQDRPDFVGLLRSTLVKRAVAGETPKLAHRLQTLAEPGVTRDFAMRLRSRTCRATSAMLYHHVSRA
jgi:hypothetical protein